jgi:hypothetical protein
MRPVATLLGSHPARHCHAIASVRGCLLYQCGQPAAVEVWWGPCQPPSRLCARHYEEYRARGAALPPRDELRQGAGQD